MAKQPKRLTRAQKIEKSRQEAAELRTFQAKPWWPEKAHTEEEAVKKIYHRLLELEQIAGEPELAKEETDLRAFLEAIPVAYREKAQAKIDAYEARQRALEEADDYDDYYDPEEAAREEERERQKWFDTLKIMSMDELKRLRDRLANQQGRLGDAEHIDDRKVEEVESKWRSVDNEILRRKAQEAA